MDNRWPASVPNVKRNAQVFLHPSSDLREVTNQTSVDAIDLSEFVSGGTHTQFQANVRLTFNETQFYGNLQPAPGQVLEIRTDNMPLWVGYIDSLQSYQVAYGTRELTIVARSRDSLDIWRISKRVTPLYPQGTPYNQIITDVALMPGLAPDEILLPASTFNTAHFNTQMANITAWEMVSTIMMPMGLSPFIDWGGRLKGASRDIKNRASDITLDESQTVKVTANRSKAPTTRYILQWLDPVLTNVTQQGRKLASATITTGWFSPYIRYHVFFSADTTQRAAATYLVINQSCNNLLQPSFIEDYQQIADNEGSINLTTTGVTYIELVVGIVAKLVAAAVPDGVITGDFLFFGGGVTIPVGRIIEAAADITLLYAQASMGTGIYEVWGNPYDAVHARNTSEAYDQNAPPWMDNPQTVSSDFIISEAHAGTVVVRELIYLSKAADKWTVTITDDRRIEYGDIIQFPDGSRMYVEDFTRSIQRDAKNELEVTGFLA